MWGIARNGIVAAAVCFLAAFQIPPLHAADDPAPNDELDQGWTRSERTGWYTATQGSRLIPLAWLRALEQPGTTDLFLDPKHIASLGYLPRGAKASGSLPVGFAVDTQSDADFERTKLRWKSRQSNKEAWVGLTCAACHTGELAFNGTRLRIDGGSATGDFQAFMERLDRALIETRDDAAKWSRFADRVLKNSRSPNADRDKLKTAFAKLVEWQELEAHVNRIESSDVRYGPGRVDAFGRIYNKIALLLKPSRDVGNRPSAPVSIPFIWRGPQLDKVQYNGIARKIPILFERYDVGALGRNTGEVIGVFADVVPNTNPGVLNGFKSSIHVHNLTALEDQLARLRPPKWPSAFFAEQPSPERTARVAKGKTLFAERCASCHAPTDRTNLTTVITTELSLFDDSGRHSTTGAKLSKPGTDPWMACNAWDYTTDSGVLEGYSNQLLTERPIPGVHKVADLLRISVAATLLGKKWALSKEAAAKLVGVKRELEIGEEPMAQQPLAAPTRTTAKEQQLERCSTTTDPLLGYTSRPLNGIWASPPYLHNGSVPTIYDLLLPPAARPTSFFVGSRQYDPVKLGYATAFDAASGNTFEFIAKRDGKVVDGNWNEGHDYSNGQFTDEDRYSLIEYLKTL